MWNFLFLIGVITMAMSMVAGCASRVSAPPYQGVDASTLYEVKVNGQPVFVYPCRVTKVVDDDGKLLANRHQTRDTSPAAVCSFDFDGEVDVEVTVASGPRLHTPLQTAVIRPLRHAVTPTIQAQTLKFKLRAAGQYSIEPNGQIVAPLHLFANEMESRRPKPDDANVRYFPPGEHVIGKMDVQSNTTIYLAAGAVVRGHIWGENVSNVRIIGRGIFDLSKSPGEGTPGPRINEFGIDNRGMRFFKCRDISIEGITILNAPSWGIEINHCDQVHVKNVKVISCRGASDGIDICSSSDVTVEGSFFRTHDDSLNVKGLTDLGYPADAKGKWTSAGVRKPATRIQFLRCVVWNDRAHALMIGPETRTTEISDVLYQDIDIIHALSVHAMAIFSADAALIQNIRYENIRVENAPVMELFGIRIGPTYVTADPVRGPVKNVVYKNIDVMTDKLHSAIFAENDASFISGVRFENVRFDGKPVKSAEEAHVHTRGPVSNLEFK